MFLKKTYRQLSRQYHPDFHPNDPNAESKMKELTQAKRFFFDEFGLDLLPSSYEEPLDIERDDEIHNTPSETLRLVS
ncbi:DnaJ domain-containing protein [Candidatus Uhrbacteria bacterium]|nr:DnaJ domain-containing protein [Candidatus Uhrbacteria bacterium]